VASDACHGRTPQLGHQLGPNVTSFTAVLIAVSGFIRNLLVQYLGDVAIYIQPHAVDRFYELRGRIKKLARETVHPVYAIKDANGRFAYDSIAVTPVPFDVKSRTKLLLTFGSPR
jgi:hypothetical protein